MPVKGMQLMNINGVQLDVMDIGSGDPVMFIHGGMGDDCLTMLADPARSSIVDDAPEFVSVETKKEIRYAESAVVPDATHLMFETNPRGTAESLAESFRRHQIPESVL